MIRGMYDVPLAVFLREKNPGWSDYSDLTRPFSPQNVAFWKGNPRLFQGNLGAVGEILRSHH